LDEQRFIVREFKIEDLNKVMDINLECLPENYSSYFYRDLHRRFPKTFLVAETENTIQGYMMCRIERGFSKLKKFTPIKSCHVVSIAVRKSYRRRGIATCILRQAMNRAAEEYSAAECYLEVRISNISAIKLYEKLGFEKVKRNHGYYLDGEDALVMVVAI
jgi:ribosomal-protein-alanine N-acetyltransferase